MIISDHWRSGFVTESTERKRTYVKPDRSGTSYDPNPVTRITWKPMEIRIVRGRVEIVECE